MKIILDYDKKVIRVSGKWELDEIIERLEAFVHMGRNAKWPVEFESETTSSMLQIPSGPINRTTTAKTIHSHPSEHNFKNDPIDMD